MSEKSKSKSIQPNILLLCADGGILTWQLINGLRTNFPLLQVIMEAPESKKTVLKRRLRKNGYFYLLGFLGFVLWTRIRALFNKRRLAAIQAQFNLNGSPSADLNIIRVHSINSSESLDAIKAVNPDVIAVFGTRVMKSSLLHEITVPLINYHSGVLPTYRGQQPAYWALARDDRENAGISVHLIDEGVDTGAVIYRKKTEFTSADNVGTYDQVQMGHAIPLLIKAIKDALHGTLKMVPSTDKTNHWFPPTIWRYLFNGFTKGVW